MPPGAGTPGRKNYSDNNEAWIVSLVKDAQINDP